MSFFPNSLELERRLRHLGADVDLLNTPFVQLERFKLRFRDEIYMLMAKDQIEAEDLSATLAAVTKTPKCAITFLSNEECKTMPRAEQYLMYELTRTASIRNLLMTKPLADFASMKEDGRRMVDVVKGAIGTRRLTLALDNTFGNSFASIFKRDIVAVWLAYFRAFLPDDLNHPRTPLTMDRVECTGKLVDYLTQALPAVRLPEPPHAWIAFTA